MQSEVLIDTRELSSYKLHWNITDGISMVERVPFYSWSVTTVLSLVDIWSPNASFDHLSTIILFAFHLWSLWPRMGICPASRVILIITFPTLSSFGLRAHPLDGSCKAVTADRQLLLAVQVTDKSLQHVGLETSVLGFHCIFLGLLTGKYGSCNPPKWGRWWMDFFQIAHNLVGYALFGTEACLQEKDI